DLRHPEFDHDLAQSLDNESTAQALYLRSTAWNSSAYERLKSLEGTILACWDGMTPVMVTEQTNKPLTIRVLPRGNWMDDSGAICQPKTPGCLPKLSNPDGHKFPRLDLAHWLCAPNNPLTTRTIVNRVWKQFFGAGLSTQVDDVGTQGEPPAYPELLDWLAVEFRESGWNVKHMVKLMVMSHTYRQTSDVARSGDRATTAERDTRAPLRE